MDLGSVTVLRRNTEYIHKKVTRVAWNNISRTISKVEIGYNFERETILLYGISGTVHRYDSSTSV